MNTSFVHVRHFLLNTLNFLFSTLLGNEMLKFRLLTISQAKKTQLKVAKLAVVSRSCDLIPMTAHD